MVRVLACIVALGAIARVAASPIASSQQVPLQQESVTGRLFAQLRSSLSIDHLAQLGAHIDAYPEQRLVQLDPSTTIQITEGEKALLTASGIKFIDVTDDDAHFTLSNKGDSLPSKLRFNSTQLGRYFDDVDTKEMKAFLTKFTSFRTRYYRSDTGKQSQQFLLSTIKDIIAKAKGHVSVSEFAHPWGQNSIIVRFEPASDGDKDDKWRMQKKNKKHKKHSDLPIVVIGAHQDSTNLLPFLAAPGADDDGSGTTSVLAVLRSLIKNEFVPKTRALELQFYSAEEGGMLGSSAVVQDYVRTGKTVAAMLQADMTAWVKKGTEPVVGIVTDFVDPAFTAFVRKLVDEYAEIGWVDTKCGYACSDHSSWTKVGVPSAFTIEAAFENTSHNIHSGNDRIDYSPEFSFEHMAQFSRIMLGLAVELTA